MENCAICPLSKLSKKIAGIGRKDAPFLVFMEAPGDCENTLRRGFVSAGSKLLLELLTEAGITEKDRYLTYMVKCRPCDTINKGAREPTSDEVYNCHSAILEEISELSFQAVIFVGNFTEKFYRLKLNVPYVKVTDPKLIVLNGGKGRNLYIDNKQKVERFHAKITGK